MSDNSEPEVDDAVIVNVMAEHLLNVMQAVCASGQVEPERAFRCASQALVQLDVLVAEDRAGRGRVASPHHTSALVALDMLRRALAPMKVRAVDRIEGVSLLATFDRALDACQAAVLAHWEMQVAGTQGAPLKLLLPDGSAHTVSPTATFTPDDVVVEQRGGDIGGL